MFDHGIQGFVSAFTIEPRFILFSECALYDGYNCQHACSKHCINHTCDRVNGSCLYGCTKDKTCKIGILNCFIHQLRVLKLAGF